MCANLNGEYIERAPERHTAQLDAKFEPVLLKDLSIRKVETVGEAIAFLQTWPVDRRSEAFQIAIESALAAAIALSTPSKAREAFRRFASEANILADTAGT
jgi:hypothetical protein